MIHELTSLHRPATVTAVIALAFSLAACNRTEDERTTGQRVDSAIEQTRTATDNAKQEINAATTDIKNDTKAFATEANDKIADAAITASVNADLAKDPDLSALKIDVDTHNGQVTLHGTAPNDSAKQRATQLASNIKGVTGVKNELSVQQ